MSDGKLIFDTDLDTSGLKKGLGNAESAMSATGGKASKAFGAMKAGAVAAGAAIVKIGVDSVKAYSNYEQLVGGVDTLFKDASKQVQQYAAEAYKTSGLSANQYMEQATSFSASLLQSLDGDTKKAAEVSNMAINDMSDNANKMGTDIGMIQNAYQGFAKQNYTMLDNLKLGYGGTRGEMERLLSDAEKLTGKKYDINNLNDVFEAIHAIQTEMDITGTTAKEAEHTIQGSFGMMKASWENLLVAMSNPDADVSKVLNEFIQSVGTFAKNVIPIVNNFASAFGEVIVQLAPQLVKLIGDLLPTLTSTIANLILAIAEAIPPLCVSLIQAVAELIPQLIDAVTKALPQIIGAITKAIPEIISAITTAIPKIIDGIMKALPQIVQAVTDAIPMIIQAVTDSIPALITAITMAIPQIIQALTDALPQIITAITNAIPEIVTAITTALPQIIEAVIQAIPQIVQAVNDNLPQLISAIFASIPQIVQAILTSLPQIATTVLKLLPMLLTVLGEVIGGLLSMLGTYASSIGHEAFKLAKMAVGKIKEGLGTLVDIAANWIKSLLDGIKSKVGSVTSTVHNFAKSLPQKIKSGIGSLFHTAANWLSTMWNGLQSKIAGIRSNVFNFAKSLPQRIKSGLGSLYHVGTNFVQGLWNGIRDKIGGVIQMAKDKIAALPEAVKKVLGIESPSVVAEKEIGWMWDEGLIEGIGAKTGELVKTARKQVSEFMGAYDVTLPVPESPLQDITASRGAISVPMVGQQQKSTTNNYQTINFNEPVQTPAQTARMLREEALYGLAGA